MKETVVYPVNLHDFAEKFCWFMTAEEALADKDSFLVLLMARLPDEAYEHACQHFNFTDIDFIHALENAPPGIFLYEHEWIYWNTLFGITPPLPFPVIYCTD